MKRNILIIALAGMLFSCSSGPEKAAKNFTENVAKGKIEEAKKYATESTGKMVDLVSGFGALPIEPDFKFHLLKDSVVNNRAWVTYENQEGEKDVIKTVKIDGKWLVHEEMDK